LLREDNPAFMNPASENEPSKARIHATKNKIALTGEKRGEQLFVAADHAAERENTACAILVVVS
jgi:hypothetical protein